MLSPTMSHLLGCGKLNFLHDCDYYTVTASCCTHRKSVCFLCKHTGWLAHFMWYRHNTEKNCLMQCASYIHDIFGFRSTWWPCTFILNSLYVYEEKKLFSYHQNIWNHPMTFVTPEKNGVLNHTAVQTSRLNSMYTYGLYIDLDHFWLYIILHLAFRCQSECASKKAVCH
jgi:hypothetical protein